MCELVINDVMEEMSEEIQRLGKELSFERQLNEMLENLTKYSLDLKTNCFCERNKQTFVLFNDLHSKYKTFRDNESHGSVGYSQTRHVTHRPSEDIVGSDEESGGGGQQSGGNGVKVEDNTEEQPLSESDNRSHDSTDSDKAEESGADGVDSSDGQTQRFICFVKHCHKVLPDIKTYRAHRLTHSAAKAVNRSGRRLRSGGHEDNHSLHDLFECDFNGCGKTFKRLDRLKAHRLWHNKRLRALDRSDQSSSKAIADKTAVKTQQSVESDDRPFRCPECNKRFKTRNHLVNHRLVRHHKAGYK